MTKLEGTSSRKYPTKKTEMNREYSSHFGINR